MAGYRVELPAYHGPLDLLLHLVRRGEVEPRAVSLAALARQFLDFLTAAATLDVDLAGEFIVLAATLLELKAQALLPRAAAADPEPATPAPPDARRDLVRHLLEYRQFQGLAQALEERALRHATQFPRLAPPPAPDADAEVPIRPVEVWDLVSAFARLLRETELSAADTITPDDTPQHVYEQQVLDALSRHPRLTLRTLFTPPHTRIRLIGLFLAVLELVKRQSVTTACDHPFDELWLTAGPGTHADGGDGR